MKLIPRKTLSLAAAALTSLFATSHSHAVTVAVGQMFVVDFHLPAVASNRNPSDTVFFAFGRGDTGVAMQGTALLLDGTTALGTNTSYRNAIGGVPFYFLFSSSPLFAAPVPASAARIDGSSLLNRTIDGHMKITFDADFTFDQVFLSTGQAIGGSAIYGEGGYNAVVDRSMIEASAAVPEPQTTALLALGLVVLGLASRRRTPCEKSKVRTQMVA